MARWRQLTLHAPPLKHPSPLPSQTLGTRCRPRPSKKKTRLSFLFLSVTPLSLSRQHDSRHTQAVGWWWCHTGRGRAKQKRTRPQRHESLGFYRAAHARPPPPPPTGCVSRRGPFPPPKHFVQGRGVSVFLFCSCHTLPKHASVRSRPRFVSLATFPTLRTRQPLAEALKRVVLGSVATQSRSADDQVGADLCGEKRGVGW